MASFPKILMFPNFFRVFKPRSLSGSCSNIGALNNVTKLILSQPRCSLTKSVINLEENQAVTKQKHSLSQKNYVAENKDSGIKELQIPPQAHRSLSHLREDIGCSPLNYKSIRGHLYRMLSIFKLCRSSPDFETEMDSFIKSDEFENLAQALEESIPMASTKFLHLIFEVMHSYRIPCSSILMQKLHALILDNINNFELSEVITMHLIIKNSNDKLLEPLNRAFLAYMTHFTSDKMKYFGNLRKIIYVASNKDVPVSVREKIFQKIFCLKPRLKDLGPVNLTWLSSLLSTPDFKYLDKTSLLDALKETVREDFDFKYLKIVLRNMIDGLFGKVIRYDRKLFDLMAGCACKYNLWEANDVLTTLNFIGHLNYELANAVADKLIKCELKSQNARTIERAVINFADMDYKSYLEYNHPEKWEKLKKVLKEYFESEVNVSNIETGLALFILSLDTDKLASQVLSPLVEDPNFRKQAPPMHAVRAHLLYQYHCSVYSSPPENVPESFVRDCLSLTKDSLSSNWKEALCEFFYGEEHVLENCKTPIGTLVSYCVIVGPDNNPINLSSYKKICREDPPSLKDFIEIEKIERPPGSKMYLFVEHRGLLIKYRRSVILRPEARSINFLHKEFDFKIIHLFVNKLKNNLEDQKTVLFNLKLLDLDQVAESQTNASATPEQQIL